MVARNDFLFAWLVVATFLLILVVGGTVFFVYKSGLLSGEVPLVATTSALSPFIENPDSADSASIPTGGESLKVPVYCAHPALGLLASETRGIPGSTHDNGRILNVLRALHQPPENPQLAPAVPPELQFRAVFVDPDSKTVYIDLTNLPEAWREADPLEVGLGLYAIAHTVTGLSPDFRFIRFLVEGKETDQRPGGFLLSEPFGPSPDWLAKG